MTSPDVLDNPFWWALTGPQTPWAQREGGAVRFAPDVAPFAAVEADTPQAWADLAALLPNGQVGALFWPSPPVVPDPFEVTTTFRVVQMVLRELVPTAQPDAEPLGPEDLSDMLDLVRLTRPGPFRPRAAELGRFVGVRRGGRLVAMAGERARLGGWSEISGVCVHPDERGRGLAAGLVTRVAEAIRARSDAPFLHVDPENAGALRLYTRLGFVERATLHGVVVRRTADGV